MATETKTFYPGAYDKSDYAFYRMVDETNPVGKSYTNSSRANMFSSGSGDRYAFWPFSVSGIPDDAEIISVECTITAYLSRSSYTVTSATAQLYSGATPKGTASSIKTTATTPISLNTGSWTRGELDSIRLKLFVRITNSDTYYVYFHGADLTVTYTYQSEKFMLKLSGDYEDIARTFKRVSGIWVEQTDLANVIEDGVRYQNGGEIISPNKTVTIIGDGGSYASVTIDGVKYTSAAKVSVPSGTPITLAATGTSAGGGSGSIFVDSNDTPVKTGLNQTYQHTVTNHVLVMIQNQVLGGYVAASVCIMVTGVSSNILSCNLFISGSTFAYPIPFEAGMTWAEMISSRYNIIAGCSISGNQVVLVDSTSGSVVAYISGVTPSDVIEADKDYQAITI